MGHEPVRQAWLPPLLPHAHPPLGRQTRPIVLDRVSGSPSDNEAGVGLIGDLLGDLFKEAWRSRRLGPSLFEEGGRGESMGFGY